MLTCSRGGADLLVVKQGHAPHRALPRQGLSAAAGVQQRRERAEAHGQVVQPPREDELVLDACTRTPCSRRAGVGADRWRSDTEGGPKGAHLNERHTQHSRAHRRWCRAAHRTGSARSRRCPRACCPAREPGAAAALHGASPAGTCTTASVKLWSRKAQFSARRCLTHLCVCVEIT